MNVPKLVIHTFIMLLLLPLLALADTTTLSSSRNYWSSYQDYIQLRYPVIGSRYAYRPEMIDGPNKVKISCSTLGNFGSGIAGAGEGLLWDSLGNKIQQYGEDQGQGYTGIPFVKWTPDVVVFLKNTVDTCVQQSKKAVLDEMSLGNAVNGIYDIFRTQANRNISTKESRFYESIKMSPSLAKDMIDHIYAIASSTNETMAQIAEAERQKEVDRAKQETELQNHIRQLKSGEVRVQNIDDAIYYHSPKTLDSIIGQPLLRPDLQYYAGTVILDQQESADILRAKVMNLIIPASSKPMMPIAYVILRNFSKAVTFNPEVMRLEQNVRVVGKYVANAKYTTVSGEVRTSPVIQLMYIGK